MVEKRKQDNTEYKRLSVQRKASEETSRLIC